MDTQLITDRLAAVEELNSPEFHDKRMSIKTILTQFPDIDQIVSLSLVSHRATDNAAQVDSKLNKIIGLRQSLELTAPLQAALASASSPVLTRMSSLLEKELTSCYYLLEMVRLVIQDSAVLRRGNSAMKFQRPFAGRSFFLIFLKKHMREH